MKNINRDYLVTVNAKTSTLSANAMSFYITDILTSNIFFQLIFNESGNALINSYAPNENADDYALTLRVVKPNNEPKELILERLDSTTNFFIADLTADFIDILGMYNCELFVNTTINGRAERSTTNSFTYVVKPSIFNNLDEIIEGDPDYPLVDNLATKEYVDQAIANVSGGGTSYDDSELRTLISSKADTNHTHTEYAPKNNPSFTGTIKGSGNFAVGSNTIASGNYSHAEGSYTTASGHGSHVEGVGTVATANFQHVQGRYNIAEEVGDNEIGSYVYIVGNGISNYNRSNAHTLDWDGNGWYAGELYVGGTSQTDSNKVLSTADISFTADGDLSITIDGVTKLFTPKA